MEQKIKRNETFEITLYHGKRIKYVIQITCMPEDFYRLKFLFCNTNTVEDLSKSLLEIDCTLKNGTNEVRLGSKIFLDKSEIIRDKIEGVINNVKATSNIQVHCAETSIAEDKLVEKCEEFSSEFKRGNIAVYEKGKRVWIVGRNNEEMEVLEKRLIEGNVLQKAPYSSKGLCFFLIGLVMKLYECKNLPVLQKENHITEQMNQKIIKTYMKFLGKHYHNIEYF